MIKARHSSHIRDAIADSTLLGWALLVGWFLLLAFGLPANAQAAGATRSIRQACSADIRTLCSGTMPGGGRIKKCMMEKRDQLSQGCKDAVKTSMD